jgi:phosphate transport system permease protein
MTTTTLGDSTKAPTFHPIGTGRKVKNSLAAVFFAGSFLIATVPLIWVLYTVLERGFKAVVSADWWGKSLAGVLPDQFAGGVYHAIYGTIIQALIAAVLSVPLGIMAAVYMREYAKQGPMIRAIRISVNNLAGVPSIVYGVFGLGFFVYVLGGSLDALFFPEAAPAPVFGSPGILWASLTLAILTLPVVIVATEEGLSRVPSTIREGSLALGATRAETLWRTVLPMASPAMMTGLILAVARAAGEVAPLMLVGVVKLAPSLPVDGNFPFVHLERKFMHLGFHIYDVGFQSPNVEAARPLVYATALLLVIIIVVLNLFAINLRNRLREKLRGLEGV